MKRFVLGISLLATFNAPAYCADGEKPIGTVVTLSGRWKLFVRSKKDTRMVKRFDAVPAGARLLPATRNDSIEILLKDTTSIVRKGFKDSDKAITLSAIPSYQDLFANALTLLGQRPEQFVPTLARTTQRNYAHEAVVKASEGKIELGPAISDLPEGAYHVVLIAIDPSAKQDTRLGPFELDWRPGQSGTCATPGIDPGLYRLDVLKPTGETTGSQAWILTAKAAEHEAKNRSFQSVEKVVLARRGVEDLSTIALLRASLQALATQESTATSPSSIR